MSCTYDRVKTNRLRRMVICRMYASLYAIGGTYGSTPLLCFFEQSYPFLNVIHARSGPAHFLQQEVIVRSVQSSLP